MLLVTGQPIGLAASDYFGQVTFNGVPVPGVTVTATQADRRADRKTDQKTNQKTDQKTTVTTDLDGIYHLADLADGLWILTIGMLGFDDIRREITVPAEEEPSPSELTVRS